MLPEILYAALIGGLVALLYSAIVGIPKLIKFIVHKLSKSSAKSENQDTTEHFTGEENMSIITSKRIAAVISLVLCAALYLSFLSAFTTKRDTYICYTTKTGTHFHSATCKYLNTAYETTVYEASQKYKPCNYCNPCIEQYETTITYRNYVIPIFISVPISGAVFLLLTYKKKKK